MTEKPDPEYLRELLRIGDDGLLYWLVDRRVGRGKGRVHKAAGSLAGCIGNHGYYVIRIDGVLYLAHRVAFAIANGRWPDGELDHADRNRLNNRPENLRECSSTENKANRSTPSNNSSGVKGVSWNKKCRKWQVHIAVGGPNQYLGLYESLDYAREVYAQAAEIAFGEFACV